MQNDQISYQKPKNLWKVIAIVFIALAMLSLIAATMLYIQNVQKNNTIVELEGNANNAREDGKNEISQDNGYTPSEKNDASSSANPEWQTLTIKEWNMRFVIPDGLNKLHYKISNNRLDFIGVLSAEHTSYLDDFSINSEIDEFIYVVRYSANNDPEKGCIESCPGLIGSNSGYNYYVGHRQNWAYNSMTEELQAVIANYLLRRMLFNVKFI